MRPGGERFALSVRTFRSATIDFPSPILSSRIEGPPPALVTANDGAPKRSEASGRDAPAMPPGTSKASAAPSLNEVATRGDRCPGSPGGVCEVNSCRGEELRPSAGIQRRGNPVRLETRGRHGPPGHSQKIQAASAESREKEDPDLPKRLARAVELQLDRGGAGGFSVPEQGLVPRVFKGGGRPRRRGAPRTPPPGGSKMGEASQQTLSSGHARLFQLKRGR